MQVEREANKQISVGRRQLLLAGAGTLATGMAAASSSAPKVETATTGKIPMVLPRTEFVYEAIVDVASSVDLGMGPLGQRRMVPILGGNFEGPGLRGKVLPNGGMDRQLVRKDGVKRLDALYEMQTEDGAILTVRNQVVIDDGVTPRYAFSAIEITAPDGPYAWLNRIQLVGTLNSLRPERNAVVIRAFKLV